MKLFTNTEEDLTGAADQLIRSVNRKGELGNRLHAYPEGQPDLLKLEWYWQPKSKKYGGWNLPIQVWRGLLESTTVCAERLNKLWNKQKSARRWGKRLHKLWKSHDLLKEKIWVWKLIQHSVPTRDGIAKWGHRDEICNKCKRVTESAEHLLIDCFGTRQTWSTRRKTTPANME
ncbi:hypothetical protein R1sor_001547 [Riccia sorocarpa]|uniref:Reverse transcriptase zinc-binding domain-containing protein n=1 Tax=Riccia sorocarpa TaxID=122646 RepID=A0ABD3GZD9_9MARC